MSPERVGSPLGLEPRELALALQTAVPPFKLVRLQLNTQQPQTTNTASTPEKKQKLSPGHQDQDDDLTSLTWLQDNNLLKGMNLTCVKTESDEMQQTTNTAVTNTLPGEMLIRGSPSTPQQTNYSVDQSPTSDYMDESSVSEPTDSSSSSLNSPVPYSYNNNTPSNTPASTTTTTPSKSNKHPHNVRYDPMVHTFSKPPYSFSCLIFMAIEDSPMKALPVKDIYAWILDHFPYFKNAPTGWKNSVRHNLSLNKCFQKVEKSPNLGKGSLWMVDQQYRPNLLQALTRSPFHPYSTLDPATFRSTSSRTSSPFVQQMIDTKTSTRLPNPELFPYLSRRLAASEAVKQQDVKVTTTPQNHHHHHHHQTHSEDDDESSLDDVHAATAILCLKHGSRMILPESRFNGSTRDHQQTPTEMVQVITRSPSEDHTYSSATTNTENTHTIVHRQEEDDDDGGSHHRTPDRAPSPDEAFESDDSMHSRVHYSSIDLEEQRRIEEGADALLNLAGISTLRNSNNNNNNDSTSYHTPMIRRSRRRGAAYNYEDDDENNEENTSTTSSSELGSSNREHQTSLSPRFRPRMLRTKRKLNVDVITSNSSGVGEHAGDDGGSITVHQSKRSKLVNNNNNNNIDSKMTSKFISTTSSTTARNGDWGVQKFNREEDQIFNSHR